MKIYRFEKNVIFSLLEGINIFKNNLKILTVFYIKVLFPIFMKKFWEKKMQQKNNKNFSEKFQWLIKTYNTGIQNSMIKCETET